ncbi:MAG TPA: HIT domain-containing protein [Bryobacteraceae bacterium]|jgi:ATP adenylyltransferase|nr:HIT domain-containing protein [Bryobacteraceae bacterium]
MDHIWSPWRYGYVTKQNPPKECIFCIRGNPDQTPEEDRQNYVLYRGKHCFAILNLFPYSAGHLMVVPYEHVATLEAASREAVLEMMDLTRESERHLRRAYGAPGLNLGMNIGESAGAGIAGHIHMHVLPRWPGDTNFMTTVAETRVLPEDLSTSYEKLYAAFHEVPR